MFEVIVAESVALVMVCADSCEDVLVAWSLPLSVVNRVSVATVLSDVELMGCGAGTVTEVENADDVSCGKRLNDKEDAAPAAVVDDGWNERHGK